MVPIPLSRPEVELDRPNPMTDRNALNVAISGRISSPLTELRDSYFPRMSFGLGRSRTKRSMSIKTAVTGMTGMEGDHSGERPYTPGGILDGYVRENTTAGEDTGTIDSPTKGGLGVQGMSRLDLEPSPRRRFFGRILGEG